MPRRSSRSASRAGTTTPSRAVQWHGHLEAQHVGAVGLADRLEARAVRRVGQSSPDLGSRLGVVAVEPGCGSSRAPGGRAAPDGAGEMRRNSDRLLHPGLTPGGAVTGVRSAGCRPGTGRGTLRTPSSTASRCSRNSACAGRRAARGRAPPALGGAVLEAVVDHQSGRCLRNAVSGSRFMRRILESGSSDPPNLSRASGQFDVAHAAPRWWPARPADVGRAGRLRSKRLGAGSSTGQPGGRHRCEARRVGAVWSSGGRGLRRRTRLAPIRRC